jgi:hypothetical protein
MRSRPILRILFWISFGVALHDFAHGVWELKGTPLSPEGGYIGFAGIALSIMLMRWENKRQRKLERTIE